jgi:lipoate-protein ligase A
MTRYVWSDLTPRPAWQQMAIDHALLDRAERDGTTVLRVYTWDLPSLSFGANEAATKTWDRDRLERALLPCVRRPTGGRAVWHAPDDLTYAITGPLAAFGGLKEAYETIHTRFAKRLAGIGLAATLAPPPAAIPGLEAGACFDVAVGGEILHGERKVIGSAQVAQGAAMLQHGAVARADRLPQLERFRLRGRLETVATPVPTLPPVPILAMALLRDWLDDGAEHAPEELTAWAESATVKHLRYRSPAWTWRR